MRDFDEEARDLRDSMLRDMRSPNLTLVGCKAMAERANSIRLFLSSRGDPLRDYLEAACATAIQDSNVKI